MSRGCTRPQAARITWGVAKRPGQPLHVQMSSLRNGGESAARRDGNAQGCECKWLVVSGAVRLHSQLTPPQKRMHCRCATCCSSRLGEPGPVRAAMLQQPRVPPTGQRQAIEIAIKWREVLAQKQALLRIMAHHTGHSIDKLDKARHHRCTALHRVWRCA